MGGSYRQCQACGKRALSIATRCPGCGRELELPPAPESSPAPALGRFIPKGAAAAAVLAAIVVGVELSGESWMTNPPRGSPAVELEVADSLAAASEVAYAMGATARLDTAGVEMTPTARGEYLVARTWTNVRSTRSTRAGLEAVLTPGDTVFADSLDRDWYRVAFEGEVMGYAHRSTLAPPKR
jgi:rRNA maturation protein Nop10